MKEITWFYCRACHCVFRWANKVNLPYIRVCFCPFCGSPDIAMGLREEKLPPIVGFDKTGNIEESLRKLQNGT